MSARPASACRPVPARRASHNCLGHLTPVGTHTDRDGLMWADYACAVDGTGYEFCLGTAPGRRRKGEAR